MKHTFVRGMTEQGCLGRSSSMGSDRAGWWSSLVNGMRIAPYGRQSVAGSERTGVDLDNILISAIDRIEVMSDGATSLYGTDALAGVVNIIMNEERTLSEKSARTDERPSG